MKHIEKNELKRRLKNTNIPTILVEGKDDILIYRWLADWAGFSSANIQQCEGCLTLREIYRERHLYPLVKLYITDQDMFIFSTIPEDLTGMCFTSGYSIENDLFADGENFLDGLLSSKDKTRKAEILKNLVDWFAFEVELFLGGNAQDTQFSKITLLSEKIMKKRQNCFTTSFLQSRNYGNASQQLISQIVENYSLQLRGKYLFQMIFKIIEESPNKSFHLENLWKICFTQSQIMSQKQNTFLLKLKNAIENALK